MTFDDIPEELKQQLQQSLLQQQRYAALANPLLQNKSSTEIVSGRAIRNNPFIQLLQAVSGGYGLYKQQEELDKSNKLMLDAASEREKQLKGVQGLLTGSPAVHRQAIPGPTQDGEDLGMTGGKPAIGPNRLEAIRTALSSRYPSVQKLGMDLRGEDVKRAEKTAEELVKGATSASAAKYVQTGNVGDLQPRPDVQFHEGAVFNVDKNTGDVSPALTNRFQQTPMEIPGVGNVPANRDTFTGKVTPTMGINAQLSPVNSLYKDINEADIKRLSGRRDSLDAEAAKLPNVVEATKLLQAGAITGTAADIRIGVEKAARLFGIDPSDKALAGEKLNRTLVDNVLAAAKQLAPVSNTDLAFIANTKGAGSGSPEAIAQSLKIYTRNLIAAARTQAEDIGKTESAIQTRLGGKASPALGTFMPESVAPYTLSSANPQQMSRLQEMAALQDALAKLAEGSAPQPVGTATKPRRVEFMPQGGQ